MKRRRIARASIAAFCLVAAAWGGDDPSAPYRMHLGVGHMPALSAHLRRPLTPSGTSLLGLVSRLAPVVVSGNAAVVISSETRPLPAVTLTEVLATSDVPGGVVNILTGFKSELTPWLAGSGANCRVDSTPSSQSSMPDALESQLGLELVPATTEVPAIAIDEILRPHPQ